MQRVLARLVALGLGLILLETLAALVVVCSMAALTASGRSAPDWLAPALAWAVLAFVAVSGLTCCLFFFHRAEEV